MIVVCYLFNQLLQKFYVNDLLDAMRDALNLQIFYFV